MYRKVYEKKFRSNAEATDYADSTGWKYIGRRGILKKHDVYLGMSASYAGDRPRQDDYYKLKIFSDGYVSLHATKECGIESTSSLPNRVWPSVYEYEFEREQLELVNSELLNLHFVLYPIGPKNFALHELIKTENGFGFNRKDAAIQAFISPQRALEWAKSSMTAKPA